MDAGSIAVPLFVVFLVLKLAKVTAVARWSWWWVFSPLWIDALGTIAILIVCAVFGLTGFGVFKLATRRR